MSLKWKPLDILGTQLFLYISLMSRNGRNENLTKITRGVPCKLVKLTKMANVTKMQNLAKICYGFGKLDTKSVPLESGDFDKNGENDNNSENRANDRKRVGEKFK